MWLYVLVPLLLAAIFYGYSIRNTIKVAKSGCNSCPNKVNEDSKASLY